jgi:hypothetical protein
MQRSIKNSFLCFAALASICLLAPRSASSQTLSKVAQGTEIRLKLQNNLTTASTHAGDKFTATVVQDVIVDNQLVIPAGTTVNGTVSAVVGTRHFALFHGQAAMGLTLRNIQAAGRDIPVQMSIIHIEKPFARYQGRKRGDVKVDEGQVIEERPDIKGNILIGLGATAGTGLIGAIITHVGPGLAIGAIGGGAYILTRRGKDVDLPRDTGLLVRLDTALLLPPVGVATASAITIPSSSPVISATTAATTWAANFPNFNFQF